MPVTRLVAVDGRHPDPRVLEQAAACLQAGELVAFPTDTVYGLGCDAASGAALAALYRAKQRPRTMPLIILLARAGQMAAYARGVPPLAEAAAGRFWPGPLTIIVPASARVPLKVTGNTGRLALRQSRSTIANRLIAVLNQPLISTSANISSHPTCRSGIDVFGQMDGRVDLVLDGGACAGQGATTIDITDPAWRLIKTGAIDEKEIADCLQPS